MKNESMHFADGPSVIITCRIDRAECPAVSDHVRESNAMYALQSAAGLTLVDTNRSLACMKRSKCVKSQRGAAIKSLLDGM
jgi:hypothetical protein